MIEAPIPAPEDEVSDPLGACFTEEQLPPDQREAALTDRTIEPVLAEGVFELPDSPRHVLILSLSQLVLIDKRKWPVRSDLPRSARFGPRRTDLGQARGGDAAKRQCGHHFPETDCPRRHRTARSGRYRGDRREVPVHLPRPEQARGLD